MFPRAMKNLLLTLLFAFSVDAYAVNCSEPSQEQLLALSELYSEVSIERAGGSDVHYELSFPPFFREVKFHSAMALIGKQPNEQAYFPVAVEERDNMLHTIIAIYSKEFLASLQLSYSFPCGYVVEIELQHNEALKRDKVLRTSPLT